MKQVAIAFLVALAVGAGIGYLIVPSMNQAERVRLLVAGSVFLVIVLGVVIVAINRER